MNQDKMTQAEQDEYIEWITEEEARHHQQPKPRTFDKSYWDDFDLFCSAIIETAPEVIEEIVNALLIDEV